MSPTGDRIRSLRLRQQRTLRDIATPCGFTVSLLSKIEAGKTSPPVATLSKIAAALGVDLADLLSGGGEDVTVFTPADTLVDANRVVTEKGYAFHLLAGRRAAKTMQPFVFVAEPGKIAPGPLAHRGEEFVYVLDGKMRYRVGAITYTLGPGDSLYFSSTEPHDLEPLTKVVRFLALFTSEQAVPGKPRRTRRGIRERKTV